MEQEYRDWLVQQEYAGNVIAARISNVVTVENYYDNLDAIFDRKELEEFKALFKYSSADERNNRPNPTKIPINGNIREGLATYKSAIALYGRFRQETANGDQPLCEEDTAAVSEPLVQAKKLISLERDMQVLIRSDIEQLEIGLVIIDDGAERAVTSGMIDITAKDANGTIVVIELKIGKGGRKAIGQIAGYMSDIVEEEGDTQKVRGILVADSFDQSALSAVRIIPGLSLKKYTVTFHFADG